MKNLIWVLLQRILNPSCQINAASLSRHLKLGKGVTIGYGSHICTGSIGKYTYINKYCLVDRNTESIVSFCSIAYSVKIGLGNHPTQWVSSHPFAYDRKYGFIKQNKSFQEFISDKCIIGNDVWIGANAIILAGVKVGDGAIIGANSFVNNDVQPYSIVAGTPARHVRYRFDKTTITRLLKSKWWEWDDRQIRQKIDNFNDPGILLA